MKEITRLEKLLAKAEKDSKRCAAARGALGPDASRARMTTANAKWMRAAEFRDRIQSKFDEAKALLPSSPDNRDTTGGAA